MCHYTPITLLYVMNLLKTATGTRKASTSFKNIFTDKNEPAYRQVLVSFLQKQSFAVKVLIFSLVPRHSEELHSAERNFSKRKITVNKV